MSTSGGSDDLDHTRTEQSGEMRGREALEQRGVEMSDIGAVGQEGGSRGTRMSERGRVAAMWAGTGGVGEMDARGVGGGNSESRRGGRGVGLGGAMVASAGSGIEMGEWRARMTGGIVGEGEPRLHAAGIAGREMGSRGGTGVTMKGEIDLIVSRPDRSWFCCERSAAGQRRTVRVARVNKLVRATPSRARMSLSVLVRAIVRARTPSILCCLTLCKRLERDEGF